MRSNSVGSKKDVYDSLTAEAMLEHFKHFSLLSFLTPGILQPTPGILLPTPGILQPTPGILLLTPGILLLGQNSVAKPFNILISI